MDTSTDLFEESETEKKSSLYTRVPDMTSSKYTRDEEPYMVPSLPAVGVDQDLTNEEDIYNMPTQPVVITSSPKLNFDTFFDSEADMKSPSSSQETVICETPAKLLMPERGRTFLQIPVQIPCVSTPIKSNGTILSNKPARTPILALNSASQAFGWDTPTQPNPDISSAAQFVIAESDNSGSDTECEDAYLLPTQLNLDIHSHNTQQKLTVDTQARSETRSLTNDDDSSSGTVLDTGSTSPDLFNLPTQINPFNGNVSPIPNSRNEIESSHKEEEKIISESVPWDLVPTQPNPQCFNKENTRFECNSGSETDLEEEAMELTQPFDIHEIATQLNPMSNCDLPTPNGELPQTSTESNEHKLDADKRPSCSSPGILESFTLAYSESDTESETEQPVQSTISSAKDPLQSRLLSPLHVKRSTRVKSDSDTEWEDEAETQPAKSPTLFDQPTQVNPLIHTGAVPMHSKSNISDEDRPDTEPVQTSNIRPKASLQASAQDNALLPTQPFVRSPASCSSSGVNPKLLNLPPSLRITEPRNETLSITPKSVTDPQKPPSQEAIPLLSELETQVWVVSPQEDIRESSTQVCTVNQQSITPRGPEANCRVDMQKNPGLLRTEGSRNVGSITRNVPESNKRKTEVCGLQNLQSRRARISPVEADAVSTPGNDFLVTGVMEAATQIWDSPTQPNPLLLTELNGKNNTNSSDSGNEARIGKSQKTSEKSQSSQNRSIAEPEPSCSEEEIASMEAETQIWELPTQPNPQCLRSAAKTKTVSYTEEKTAPLGDETQIWELATQPNPQFNTKSKINSNDRGNDARIVKSDNTEESRTPQKRSIAELKPSESDGETEEDSPEVKPKTSVSEAIVNSGYLPHRSRNVIRRSEMDAAGKLIAEDSSRVTGTSERNSGADSPDVFSLSQLVLPDSEDLTPPSSDNNAKNIAKTETEEREASTAANGCEISDEDASPIRSQNVPMHGFPREDALDTPARTDLQLIQSALSQPQTPKRSSSVLRNGIPKTDVVDRSPEAECLENNDEPTPPKKPRISTRKGKHLHISENGVNPTIPDKRMSGVENSPGQRDQPEERQRELRKPRATGGKRRTTSVGCRSKLDVDVTDISVEETPTNTREINLRRKGSAISRATVTRGNLASEDGTTADLAGGKAEASKRSRGRPRKVATQSKKVKTENSLPPKEQISVNEANDVKPEPQPGTSSGAPSTVLFSPKMTRGKKKSLMAVKEPKQIAKVTGMKIDQKDVKITLAIESRRQTRAKATDSVEVNERVSPVTRGRKSKTVKPVKIKQEPEDSSEVPRCDQPRTGGAASKRESIEVKEESKWNFRERRNCAFRVLFTGIDEPDDKEVVKDLGGAVVERLEDCQVLVTDKIRRTVKFLCAVGAGKLIVSHLWLRECRIRGKFVDPVPFLLKDKQGEKQHSFELKFSLDKAKEEPLLGDWQFLLTPSILPPPPEMSEIINSSGGRVVSKFRSVNKEQAAVISVKDDENLWPTYRNLGIPILSTEAILTGVLRQHFETKPYTLRENKR